MERTTSNSDAGITAPLFDDEKPYGLWLFKSKYYGHLGKKYVISYKGEAIRMWMIKDHEWKDISQINEARANFHRYKSSGRMEFIENVATEKEAASLAQTYLLLV